jgi:transposase
MQRSAIIVMHKLGFKESDIVYWVGHDERTINHWINHFDQFNNVEDESRNGRPRATTDETDESIASVAQDIRFITPKEIRTRLHLDVSGRTVRRRLDDAGLFGRVARVSFPFTQEHID